MASKSNMGSDFYLVYDLGTNLFYNLFYYDLNLHRLLKKFYSKKFIQIY